MSQHAVWFPGDAYKQQTRLYQWMKSLGYTDYDAFQDKSIDEIEWFWDQAVSELGIEWFQDYNQTLDLSEGIKYPNWFVNGKLNVTYNAVEKWANDSSMADELALIWESDEGSTRTFTYKELLQEVNQAAAGFQDIGIEKGDIIALYLPMIPETLFSMLAASKIGAIFSPAFSGYKADAIATRINASKAKVLITADGFYRRGKTMHMKVEADKAIKQCPSIEKMIVVERLHSELGLNENTDITWSSMIKNVTDFKTEHMNAEDPFMIIYTSGTTGKPKGALHTHSGFPIKASFDAGIGMDVKKKDTLFWYTDMGWMMGPFLVYGGLINGASIVMFEGTPDFPNPNRLWDIVERHQVTHLGISPTLVRSLMKHGIDWVDQHDLSTLRVIGATGEPFNPEPWMWLFKDVGKSQIPIFNYSGGTEISGGMLGNVLVKPIGPVTFNAALPGMDVQVYNQEGNAVSNQVGELVLLKPWVGMTKGFYKENDRYEQTYWNRWPDTWVHGDWVIRDEEGFYTITGRSDDTLNVAGKRTGPAEIESVLVEHDAVVEAGVIGVPHQVKGETPIAFVVLKPHISQTDALKEEILKHSISVLGKALAPSNIYFVEDLPKTRNAKVMRRAIRTAYLNEDSGDLSALENPQIVESIRKLGQHTLK
ncbi:AMP-binding protein [Pontibacillus yanchengensis]|uniref:acetate--CoA ligase n=1 Tax=Pontibacillus yanchengensis Y32 TaxID=1385514 RepID=A0A0A2TB63_9BACI|nr:AMP-binding protein [Pontibacillus yanchengensis]KGP71663.1 AMP-dependent synthetase [Pontibacillus yanchengensis Y32]